MRDTLLKSMSTAATCVWLTSCASTLVGQDLPQYRLFACPLEDRGCSIASSGEEFGIRGSYGVEKTGANEYEVRGSVLVDTTKSLAVYTHSRVQLTFVFFEGNTVAEQLHVYVRGQVNEYNDFAKTLKTDKPVESSLQYRWRGKVSQAPL